MNDGNSDELSKSKHGADFKKTLLDELKKLYKNGLIDSVTSGKKFAMSDELGVQFQAPFFISLGEKSIAFFTTTSIRSDRLKITQWDSWGIKESNGGEVYSILVLPDSLVEKEEKLFNAEAKKLENSRYISKIDAIIKLSQLTECINNIKNK